MAVGKQGGSGNPVEIPLIFIMQINQYYHLRTISVKADFAKTSRQTTTINRVNCINKNLALNICH